MGLKGGRVSSRGPVRQLQFHALAANGSAVQSDPGVEWGRDTDGMATASAATALQRGQGRIVKWCEGACVMGVKGVRRVGTG